MFTPESFGLMQPNGHSSPMNLRLGAQASTIQFPPILFPQLSETTVATVQGEKLEVSRKCKQNFLDIIQTVMGGRSSQSGEDMVDAGIPAFCPPISRLVKGGLAAVESRPSPELVVDSQIALESSGSTPPSTLDVKKASPTSLSSPSWPSGASEILKSGGHNPTLTPDEPEERSNSGQMEIFTDSIQPDTDGIYFCHLCEYTGKKRQEFQSHLRSHYDYHCPKCDYTSRTEGRLRRHMEGFHSAVPPDNFSGKSSKPANKLRLQRCKQCDYVADTKTEYWQHQRVHIKADRQLHCTQCPFVTEYRHHLEYHIRNHLGSKPYKCSKCNYECVNKSMLNSHMKSHTNVYQYRCADCNYATKYCHSLKMHLAKYKHTQTVVLNVDGSLPERANALAARPDREVQPAGEVLPFLLPPLPALLPPLPPAFPSEVATENSQENLALMTALVLSMQQQAFPQLLPPPPPVPHPDSFPLLHGFSIPPEAEAPTVAEDDVLDLSAPKSAGRREANAPRTPSSVRYECPYCEIIFKNETLFELHKQFHDPKNPFLCKRCGTRCRDSVDFFNHINEKEHVGGL